jgi:hypothetical protein
MAFFASPFNQDGYFARLLIHSEAHHLTSYGCREHLDNLVAFFEHDLFLQIEAE